MDNESLELAQNVASEAAKILVEKDIQYFDKMVSGAERLIKPWKIALIITNLFWAAVFSFFLIFAYMSPTEIEQSQDIPAQQQEQSIKGVN